MAGFVNILFRSRFVVDFLRNETFVTREAREGQPLLTAETEVNGESMSTNERGSSQVCSLVGSSGLSYPYKRFLFSLGLSSRPSSQIFFSSQYTISILLSSSLSKLGRQPCWVAYLLVCVSSSRHSGNQTLFYCIDLILAFLRMQKRQGTSAHSTKPNYRIPNQTKPNLTIPNHTKPRQTTWVVPEMTALKCSHFKEVTSRQKLAANWQKQSLTFIRANLSQKLEQINIYVHVYSSLF